MQNFEFEHVPNLLDELEFIFKRRKKSVARDIAVYEGQIKVGTSRQCLLVDLRAAADINIVWKFRGIELVERIENENFGLSFFAEFGKMKLIRTFEVFAAAPFVILAENFRMVPDQALGMPREDKVRAAWQRVAEAFKRFSSHDDDVPDGHLLEPPEILRQMPRDLSVRANHAV